MEKSSIHFLSEVLKEANISAEEITKLSPLQLQSFVEQLMNVLDTRNAEQLENCCRYLIENGKVKRVRQAIQDAFYEAKTKDNYYKRLFPTPLEEWLLDFFVSFDEDLF